MCKYSGQIVGQSSGFKKTQGVQHKMNFRKKINFLIGTFKTVPIEDHK